MIHPLRHAFLAVGLAFCAVCAAAPPVPLDIPAQPLQRALTLFAQQTGLQVVVRDVDIAPGLNSVAVTGTHEPEEALRRLLGRSGLEYGYLNERTIAIRPAKAEKPSAPGKPSAATGAASVRMALAGATEEKQAAVQEDEEPADESGTPEMLVRGSRTLNTDIRRTEDDPQPYVVFDRDDIRASMATNLGDFFKNRLPMNTAQVTASQQTSINSPDGNISQINLRGLGTNQTLILVDGRRMPNVNRSGVFAQPDINGIPLSIVERIEILPSTASGIYGGGATGGVINIITRKDYVGVDAGLTYNNVFDSDAGERRIDLSAGLTFGNTQVLITGSYADSNELLFGDRDFVQRGRDLQFRNNANAFYSLTTPPAGYTSNIRSSNGQPLQLKAAYGGTVLSSNRTFVPIGYAGPAAEGAGRLVVNSGRYNLDMPQDLDGANQSLMNNPTVRSAGLNLRHSFGSRVEAFADFSWMDNQGRMQIAGLPASVTLAPSAPNNPFTNSIVVSFPVTDVAFPFNSGSETLRGTGGVIVRLPADWTAAADLVWSRARYGFEFSSPALGDPDGLDGPLPSVEQQLANGTLNVMRDVNLYRINYAPFALPWPNSVTGPSDTSMRDLNLRLSGPVFRLPAGPLTVSAIASRREEVAEDSFQDFYDLVESGVLYYPRRDQSVDSYYLEGRVPLFSAANGRPGLRTLELQASVRHDEYETSAPTPGTFFGFTREDEFGPRTYATNEAQATKYTVGLRFSPLEDLTLRASVGTGFLPPSIHQIAQSTTARVTTSLIDPKRSGVSASVGPYTRISGSNPNLQPESSRSWSAGLILTPRFLPDLRLSIDYTSIEKTNEISTINVQQVLDLEDYLPEGRVIRNPLTASDQQLGYTGGTINTINLTLVNMAGARLEAYDMQADYLIRTASMGEFQLRALLTHQPTFERRTLFTAPFFDFTGFSNGQLDWRGNAGVSWATGPWLLDWNAQYFERYRVYSATATGVTVTNAILNQGSAFVPRQIYHDLFVRYRFAEAAAGGLTDGLEVSLGIQNLFDRSPPILATTAATGGYSTYGDPRMRRYTISLRKQF